MRLVFVILVALLIVVPIAEISLIVAVGHQIGAVPTILLLLASAAIGSWLLRREGRRAWREVRAAAGSGRPPAMEAVSGVLVLAGGLLMMLPGFATDVIGLLLIVPPVRRLAARLVLARFARGLPPQVAAELLGPAKVRARRGAATHTAAPPDYGPAPVRAPAEPRGPLGADSPPGGGSVIDGTVIEGETER
ncbi:MAG: exlusion protein FxsA [Actinomycetia bacterium]|jgi:UPF0716 protein FxsA|nr:exlusion protein FxsA [Actinomycetes bacterium]MDQ1656695.1 protein FxsA [Cryptosporangiaceae bacterium]